MLRETKKKVGSFKCHIFVCRIQFMSQFIPSVWLNESIDYTSIGGWTSWGSVQVLNILFLSVTSPSCRGPLELHPIHTLDCSLFLPCQRANLVGMAAQVDWGNFGKYLLCPIFMCTLHKQLSTNLAWRYLHQCCSHTPEFRIQHSRSLGCYGVCFFPIIKIKGVGQLPKFDNVNNSTAIE